MSRLGLGKPPNLFLGELVTEKKMAHVGWTQNKGLRAEFSYLGTHPVVPGLPPGKTFFARRGQNQSGKMHRKMFAFYKGQRDHREGTDLTFPS